MLFALAVLPMKRSWKLKLNNIYGMFNLRKTSIEGKRANSSPDNVKIFLVLISLVIKLGRYQKVFAPPSFEHLYKIRIGDEGKVCCNLHMHELTFYRDLLVRSQEEIRRQSAAMIFLAHCSRSASLTRSSNMGRSKKTSGMITAAVKAAAMIPAVRLEWSAIAP